MSNTSKLSHEINNYLSVILSEIQSIEEKYKALAKDNDWIAMKRDTCQLSKMVSSFSSRASSVGNNKIPMLTSQSIRTKSRLLPDSAEDAKKQSAASVEAPGSCQTEEVFTIHALLQSLSHSWKLRYSKKGFRLTYINQHQEALKMRGTPFEIVQIFNNLLSNSFDALALKQQSKTTENTWFPEANLILTSFKDQIIIKLEDNGCGIPDDTVSHIFEYGLTTKKSGHGIGLAVVKELVEKHHGHIYVRSHGQHGCDFHLIFPAVKS